jgi:hypothetical protein
MDARTERLAANEVMFREVNEQIEAMAGQLGNGGHAYGFMCECSNVDCTAQVKLRLADYEAVRAHGARFVVAKGHALPDVEQVVESRPAFDVVEKQDAAADYVEARDPRT